MNAELSEQFTRILFFLGGALMCFFVLMNADAIVNFTDGALSEWNAYIVAAHLMVACGCGVALFTSQRNEKIWLRAVVLAPLVVNALWSAIAGAAHVDQNMPGLMAYSFVASASLPIVAIVAACVTWQHGLGQDLSRNDSVASPETSYLTSVTACGALLGLAFYTLLVQPDVQPADMLRAAWIGYALLSLIPALLLPFLLPGSLTTIDAVPKSSVFGSEFEKDAFPVLLLGAIPSFLMIAVQPSLTSALPGLGHAYVLPPAIAILALAIGFGRPPRLIQQIAIYGGVWMSLVAVLIFSVSSYINRYGLAVAGGYLLALFAMSCGGFVGLARLRCRFGSLPVFYLVSAIAALAGASLAELGNLVFDRLTFPIACAAIFLCFLAKRASVARFSLRTMSQQQKGL